MSNALQKSENTDLSSIEKVLMQGNLSELNPEQRLTYYKQVCESLGLNPLTKPFEYINLSGKLTLYATRACTDQLRKINKVSVRIMDRQMAEGLYIVTAQATDAHGRLDESTGATSIAGLKGDALANSIMKAETKAKRRATLSICGLGFLDESEVEGAINAPFQNTQANIAQAVRPKIESTELRAELIQHLEKIMREQGIVALANEWEKKLTKEQRILIGGEEITRIKTLIETKENQEATA